jgi:hypothetical protein
MFIRLNLINLCITLVAVFPVFADMTNLANGNNTTINAHSVCRNVTNNSGAARMIPYRTSGEWSSFYNRGHTGVTINTCAPPNRCGTFTDGFCLEYGGAPPGTPIPAINYPGYPGAIQAVTESQCLEFCNNNTTTVSCCSYDPGFQMCIHYQWDNFVPGGGFATSARCQP